MGCFNRTAFYSHLPITASDDIVLFMLGDTSKAYQGTDACPISVVGTALTPLSAPFFGKYNDYGGIELVVDDFNHKLFREKVGMTIDKFCDVMHDYDGMTINEFKRVAELLKNGEEQPNKYHGKTIEEYTNMIEVFKKILDFDVEKPELRNGDDKLSQDINRIEQHLYERRLKMHDECSIILAMEHRSIYDKMVEVGRAHYFDYYFSDRPKVTPEEAFDNTVEFINTIGKEIGGVNPFGLGIDETDMRLLKCELGDVKTDISKESLERFLGLIREYRNYFGIHVCLHDTVFYDDIDYSLYVKTISDISALKEVAVNYAYFLSAFQGTNTVFAVSPYHTQTVHYSELIPIYEEMLNTLKRKNKEEEC